MFSKHVIRTFKSKWSILLLLGIIIFLSSFIYTVISASVLGLSGPAERFFTDTNQEDVSIDVLPYLDQTIYPCVPEDITSMAALYIIDEACYQTVITTQITLFEQVFSSMQFEARFYKDAQIKTNDANHSLRILKDAQSINLSMIEHGEKPQLDHEIAIGGLYAKNNGLEIGDEINVLGTFYTITGFVLFPDYNLPIVEHPFLYDSQYQTLGMLSDAAFDTLHVIPSYSIAGTFETPESKAVFIDTFDHYDLFHFASYILTENNIRSGAIYGEISGSTAMGIFLSVMIAMIGIIIVSMVVSKTLNKERSAIGVLKALGVKDWEIRMPYLVLLAMFTLTFLALGYVIGYLLAPNLRDLFLTFYLLPKEPIPFSLADVFVSILLPFSVIMGLSYWIIARLLREDAFHLLQPRLATIKPSRFKRIQSLFNKFNLLTRFQLKQLFRSPAKIAAYVIGIFLAIYAVFIGFSMINVFDRTLSEYYRAINVDEIGFCEPLSPCEAPIGEGVIQLEAFIKDEQTVLIGLDNDTQLHPLNDRRGRDLTSQLSEGLIISKSFQDLTRTKVGDRVTIAFLGASFELTVVGVADLYPGAYVFYEREALANALGLEADFFNVVYSDASLNPELYIKVLNTSDILEQVALMNNLMQTMMLVIISGAFLIGIIVIYLLSVLSVEEQFYHISLLKVMGYQNQEIHTMMLGGYLKLNILIFILSVPLSLLSIVILKQVFIEMYGYMMPLRLLWWHVLLTLIIFIMTYAIGNLKAKDKVNTIALQEALKIYQV